MPDNNGQGHTVVNSAKIRYDDIRLLQSPKKLNMKRMMMIFGTVPNNLSMED
jgi:hypothetical protein